MEWALGSRSAQHAGLQSQYPNRGAEALREKQEGHGGGVACTERNPTPRQSLKGFGLSLSPRELLLLCGLKTLQPRRAKVTDKDLWLFCFWKY